MKDKNNMSKTTEVFFVTTKKTCHTKKFVPLIVNPKKLKRKLKLDLLVQPFCCSVFLLFLCCNTGAYSVCFHDNIMQ